MESAVQTLFIGHNPQAILQKQRKFFCSRLLTSPRTRICASVSLKRVSSENFRRIGCRIPNAILAISSDLGNIGESLATFEDFTVTTTNMGDREIKIRVDASGARTQANFDNAFSKLVAAAQPIPGFRRVKGGKTPDIPKDVLLHIIGPSKVYKQSIKKLINTTVAEFVEKKSLKVTKDLRVEQSFEELESKFQPGDDFGFDATLQFQEYGAWRMLTGEVKKCLIEVLSEMVERHCKARALVTDEVVDAFMAVRPLPYMFS